MSAPQVSTPREGAPQPGAPHGGAPPEWRELEHVPLLGMLAVAAATADLVINGVAVRTLGESLSRVELIALGRWGELPRNLAAIAGLVALGIALVVYLRSRRWASMHRRLILAAFAGIFLPILVLATALSPEILPHDDRTVKLVKIGIGAGNVLAVLLAMIAVRRAAPPGIRIGLAVAALSCFCAFAALALGELRPLVMTRPGLLTYHALIQIGEVCYLLGPIAIGVTLFDPPRTLRDWIGIGAGSLLALATASVIAWGIVSLGPDFPVVLYGAQRLSLLGDVLPWVYVAPLAACAFVVGQGLASAEATRRQIGAGVALFLCAGFAPRSPAALLTMVLGMALLSRASIALGERLIESRTAVAERRPALDPVAPIIE